MDDIRFLSVNPALVLYHIERANWTYTDACRYADKYKGYGKVAVIPALFQYCYQKYCVPPLVELYQYVHQTLCEPTLQQNPTVEWRGVKLVFDFYRELYTFGLLQRSDIFGFVQYCKAYDLNYNVDFIGQLMPIFQQEHIGIQAMMRKNWNADVYSQIKTQRRATRGDHCFSGRIYELSNRKIPPAKNVKGLWLFGDAHIQELRTQVLDERQPEAGIITTFIDGTSA